MPQSESWEKTILFLTIVYFYQQKSGDAWKRFSTDSLVFCDKNKFAATVQRRKKYKFLSGCYTNVLSKVSLMCKGQ
jgi:hypothetical protein